MMDEQQPREKTPRAKKPVEKKPAPPKPIAKKTAEPKPELTQAIADAIISADPKMGREALAKQLAIPASWVWIVRSAVQMTQVKQETVMHNRLVLKRKGIVVRKPRATKPKPAPKA